MLSDGISLKCVRRAPCAVLTVGDKTYDVERIGKGRYTTAWRNGTDHVWLQVHEKDLSKDALCMAEANPHLPECESFGWFDGAAPYRLYREPLYQPLNARSGKAWNDFKELYRIFGEVRISHTWGENKGVSQRTKEFNAKFEDAVQDTIYLSDSIKEAVRTLIYTAANCGDYGIEISKKNCAVGAKGQLILLDPLFDRAEAEADYQRRVKRSRGY